MGELGANDTGVSWFAKSVCASGAAKISWSRGLYIPWGRVTLPQMTRSLDPRTSFWAL